MTSSGKSLGHQNTNSELQSILGFDSTVAHSYELMAKRSHTSFEFQHAHFVGVGGCGMNAIAQAMLASGVKVSGSDLKESKATLALREAGATIFIGHDAENVQRPDVVVVSTAIPERNPELQRARGEEIPILHRSEALALFLAQRDSILITGTHGKTTTTALTSLIMAAGGLNPWSFVGGYVPAFEGNCRVGGNHFAVAEADESDGTFEKLPVTHLIVTNIEDEHLDYWKTGAAMRQGFRRVYESVPDAGVRVCCVDDPGVRALVEQSTVSCVSYGVNNSEAVYSATNVELHPFHSSFDLLIHGNHYGRFEIGVPGIHNVSNAVAALAMALELGADLTHANKVLKEFHGVGRRFEIKGRHQGVTILDDYGHHPTEIIATLKAAKKAAIAQGGKLWVIFQPHRFTRTRDTLSQLATAFGDADRLILLPIYSAGESRIPGLEDDAVFSALTPTKRKTSEYAPNASQVAAGLLPRVESGDVVLTIGAGDVYKIADDFCKLLQSNPEVNPDA